ncbi:MAG: hypothetical protein ACI4HI_17925 [Lachnospiraceae bacterium]
MENQQETDWNKIAARIDWKKPKNCEICGGKMDYVSVGEYRCKVCGHVVLDDYGKVRKFLEKNGPSPSIVIAKETGVELEIIEFFLRKGRLEITENSEHFVKCEKCGCDIRYGRFCPECTKKMAGGIQAIFNEDMGERPKKKDSGEQKGKLHFIKSDHPK